MTDDPLNPAAPAPELVLPHVNEGLPAAQSALQGTKPPSPMSGLVAWVRDLVISLAVSAFVIVFLYQPVKVEGGSMMPSLVNRERIFVNKFVYRLTPIERGDIVVFKYPRDTSLSFIKRIIGVPGDRIRIENGEVYVNGKVLDEAYLEPTYVDRNQSYPEIAIPAHNYFVMGDHRNMSDDSRDFGALDASYIYGKASFVYWPFKRMGRVH